MKARMSARAPDMPVTKFGLASSNARSRTPEHEQDEGDVRVGQQVQEELERVHPTTSVDAAERERDRAAPPATVTVLPVRGRQHVRLRGRDPVDGAGRDGLAAE